MSVRWLGGLIVRGRFMDVRGTIHVPVRDDDTAAVTVEIRADSVRTGISLRDRHLRGPLFLDAARHPLITFRGGDVMRLPDLHRGAGLADDPRRDAHGGAALLDGRRPRLTRPRVSRRDVDAVVVARRTIDLEPPRGLAVGLDPLFVVIRRSDGDAIVGTQRSRLVLEPWTQLDCPVSLDCLVHSAHAPRRSSWSRRSSRARRR